MSTPDRPDGPLAPWQPDRPPALPASQAWEEPAYESPADAADSPRKFSPKVVLRAVRRHWWQILLIWAVASGGLMTVVYSKVKPTFDATAYVLLEPPRKNPIGPDTGSAGVSIESQLETQAQRMLTPDILGEALKDPKVAELSRIRTALDPEALLRKELRVSPVRGTRLITVVMTSLQSSEAVAVVNAVTRAYEASVKARAVREKRELTQQYDTYLKDKEAEVEKRDQELHALVDTIDNHGAGAPAGALADEGNALDKIQGRPDMTIEEFKAYSQQLTQAEMQVQEAEAVLRGLKEEQRRGLDTTVLEQAVDRELSRDPELSGIGAEHAKAQARLDKAKNLVRPGDIVYRTVDKQVKDLKAKYLARKEALRPEIRQRLEQGDGGAAAKVRQAEGNRASLVAHRDSLKQYLSKLKIAAGMRERGQRRDDVDVQLHREDLAYSRNLRDRVRQQLDALTMDLDSSSNRIYVTPAQETRVPTSDGRKKMMLAVPVMVLLGVVGLFSLLEMAAGRVGDPDDLQGRLNLGVIGVVPPLPSLEPTTTRAGLPWIDDQGRRKRRAEEFVQSLDHLRVQLWSGRRPGAGHRCVLITSASVSEGKTTLAAQLAGRCANAGLSTLLIDADLRRPALARLLDVPQEPGLADVLAGTAEPEAAMIAIGNAGGFYLMPAGRILQDPGRLLGGPALAALLARLRETFDIIIVDAPPVLPVPDALILGRHTDGAVLAVRHDASRYPLVQRAKQKLASVGIPALGVVVNGVRGGGANYGNYAYSAATSADSAESEGPA